MFDCNIGYIREGFEGICPGAHFNEIEFNPLKKLSLAVVHFTEGRIFRRGKGENITNPA